MYVTRAVRIFLLLSILCIQFSSETSQSSSNSQLKRKKPGILGRKNESESVQSTGPVANNSTRIFVLGSSSPKKRRKISKSSSLRRSNSSKRRFTQGNSLTTETAANGMTASFQPPRVISNERTTVPQIESESRSIVDHNYVTKSTGQSTSKKPKTYNEKSNTFHIIYYMKPKSTSQLKANNDLITKSLNFIYVKEETEPDTIPTELNATPAKSFQILSWSPQGLLMKTFIEWADLAALSTVRLYFGCNTLMSIFQFKYACSTFNLLFKFKLIGISECVSKYLSIIRTIIESAPSLKYHLLPHCEVFVPSNSNCKLLLARQRIPLYFIFTSISYLIQNESHHNEFLKTTVMHLYSRMEKRGEFVEKYWKIVDKHLEELNFKPSKQFPTRRMVFYFDISTVVFIYNEMKFNSNEKVKSFFKIVWTACIKSYSQSCVIGSLNSYSALNIAYHDVKNQKTFGPRAQRLYQIKFANLVFKKSKESIPGLLSDYIILRSDFQFLPIDFRYRVFGRRDILRMKDALKNIQLLLPKFTVKQEISTLKFFTELGAFITFKFLLFIHDLWREVEDISKLLNYQESFEAMSNSIDIFEVIRRILYSKGIIIQYLTFKDINMKELTNLVFSSSNTIEPTEVPLKYSQFYQMLTDTGLVKRLQLTDELFCQLLNFKYFESQLGELPLYQSRFKWAEFHCKLPVGGSEEAIKEIFQSEEYNTFKNTWSLYLNNIDESSLKDKRELVENLKIFLILYNQ